MSALLARRAGALAIVGGVTLALAACTRDFPTGEQEDAGTPPPGLGQHPEANAACLECHTPVAERWALGSSHGILLDCTNCHGTFGPSGPGHSDSRACSDCHSQRPHPATAACTKCHDPHGTQNAFLLVETIEVPTGAEVAVHVTAVEGASVDGLVRAGVEGAEPGTGLCEVCHRDTRYYPRNGLGEPHDTGWCPRCHLHQNGFALGLP